LTPQLLSAAFSDPIRWNREKEKARTKKMTGWIEKIKKSSLRKKTFFSDTVCPIGFFTPTKTPNGTF
jgi:hypothetical protein